MKILLIITTYNQLKYTTEFFANWKNDSNIDIIFIDDTSTDGTINWLQKNNLTYITKNKPKGLTDSWNIGYSIFKKENYDFLIISNNDVLIPINSIESLIKNIVNKQIISPITTKLGAGHNWKYQSFENYWKDFKIDHKKSVNYQKVQDAINNKGNVLEMDHFNGFFFLMSRAIIKSEFNSNNLFNPANVNVHQESDLESRLINKPLLDTSSFVYHYKGVSFIKKKNATTNIKGDIRQDLNLYH